MQGAQFIIDPYILGLWCADGYWWSSSVGLSSTEPTLVSRMAAYLIEILGRDRLRLRIYETPGQPAEDAVRSLSPKISVRPAFKMCRTAYHIYVNSRPLLRAFQRARAGLVTLDSKDIPPYLAGRFDGDGALGKGRVPGHRIVYRDSDEALIDLELLSRLGLDAVSIYDFRAAAEHCLYVRKPDASRFLSLITPFSWKVSATVGTAAAPAEVGWCNE